MGARRHPLLRGRDAVLDAHARRPQARPDLGLRPPVLRDPERGRGRELARQPRRLDRLPAGHAGRLRPHIHCRPSLTMPWTQRYDPLGSWPLSTLVSALPVLTLFFVLIVLLSLI